MFIRDSDVIESAKGSTARWRTATNELIKHFQLDAAKHQACAKGFEAKTETEAIERALDFAIDEHEKNRLVAEANERFVRSGVEISDVYGKLGE